MKINELTISQSLNGLKEKKFSVKELVSSCLLEIHRIDDKINAFLALNENALKEAEDLDNKGFDEAKLLWGIPVAIKDNFLTNGLRTTASSTVLENFIPVYDATVVKKLKDAGSIILGKTNMDAWAHGNSTETSQFFTTKNPWDLDRLPGGSSGGSAAAVAADMCIAAIGSETAGSIRQPASWCGIVGFKPSYGAISRYGVVAMGSSLDCPGPMTKNVNDCRLIFDILRGKDVHDATTVEFEDKEISLDNLCIGIPTEYFSEDIDMEVLNLVNEAILKLKNSDLTISNVSLISPEFAIADYTILQRAEVSSNLGRYDGIRYGNNRTFFGDEARRRIMFGTYTLSAGYYDKYYLKAQKTRTLICQNFVEIFKKCDLLIAPTSPSPALKLGATKNQSMFGELQDRLVEASALAGLPGININCGFSKSGLPIGMQIIGPRYSEKLILNLAEKFEGLKDNIINKPKL